MVKWYVPSLAEFWFIELARFDSFLVSVERLLEDAVQDLDEQVAVQISAAGWDKDVDEFFGPPPSVEDLVEDEQVRCALGFEEGYWELEEGFPNILRKSLFVAIYSFIEALLYAICLYKERADNLPVSLEDFRDMDRSKGIELSKNYLMRVAGFAVGKIDRWQTITNYQKLRNCIVHGESRLKNLNLKQARELKKYVSRESSLEWGGWGDSIVFRKGFCEEVLKTTRSFFDQLFESKLFIRFYSASKETFDVPFTR